RDSTLKIIEIMQAAEEDAAALFRGLPSGEISHPQQDDDERRRQALKEVLDLLTLLAGIASDDEFGDQRNPEALAADAISLLSKRFPDLSRLESLTLAELMALLEDLRRQAELLSLLHSAYVLSGKRGRYSGWEWAGVPFEALERLFDRTNPDAQYWDWLSDALNASLWMFPSGRSLDKDDWRHPFATFFHAALAQFQEQFTPAEQIAFLIGLQQMIHDDPEHCGRFVVGEVPQLGIPSVMNLLAQLKQAAEQMREKVEQDEILADELRRNKVIADTSPDDLGQLLALFHLTFYSPKGSGGGGGRSTSGKGKKPDIQQVNAIAQEFGMDGPQRERFGRYVEDMKEVGERGTKNDRGDFTYQELRGLAEDFLDTFYPDARR
ncbi:MAG: hypothetical protein IAE83_21495, partial [Anaerolinea sp.]|nr:hypothetical protein [Anaerolinea sp.]